MEIGALVDCYMRRKISEIYLLDKPHPRVDVIGTTLS